MEDRHLNKRNLIGLVLKDKDLKKRKKICLPKKEGKRRKEKFNNNKNWKEGKKKRIIKRIRRNSLLCLKNNGLFQLQRKSNNRLLDKTNSKERQAKQAKSQKKKSRLKTIVK